MRHSLTLLRFIICRLAAVLSSDNVSLLPVVQTVMDPQMKSLEKKLILADRSVLWRWVSFFFYSEEQQLNIIFCFLFMM